MARVAYPVIQERIGRMLDASKVPPRRRIAILQLAILDAKRLNQAEPHKYRRVITADSNAYRDGDGKLLSAGDIRIPGNLDMAAEQSAKEKESDHGPE
jgi:hypothetical protein